MSRRLAALALYLYPLAFRRRYGKEMRGLLDESPARVMTVLDLIGGAFAAHVRPPDGLAGVVDQGERERERRAGLLGAVRRRRFWLAAAGVRLG
jgi:hypothetical protein